MNLRRFLKSEELSEFEQTICDVYANFYPISSTEIEWAFAELCSFDKTLLAIRITQVFNISLEKAVELVKIRYKF